MRIRTFARLAPLAVLGLMLVVGAPTEGQTFRERLRERLAAREGAEAPVAGVREIALTVDGTPRTALVHVPPTLPRRPAAVLVFHGGGGGDASQMAATGLMIAEADRGGFLAVYPDAGGDRWNDGRAATGGGGDDLAYLRALLVALRDDYGLDPGRVFATGISNGGMFVHRLACDAPDLVTAVASVAATMPAALREDCAPRRATPVMMFNGTADPFMPYWGGEPELGWLMRRANGDEAADPMLSAPATAEFWAAVDGCGAGRRTALPDLTDDGTTVTRIDYGPCRRGEVVLFEIEGGGHSWPGAAGRDRRIAGATSRDVDATATMLEFFRRHGL